MLEITPSVVGNDVASALNSAQGPIIVRPGIYPQKTTLDLSKLDKWIVGYGAIFQWQGPTGIPAVLCKPVFPPEYQYLFSFGTELTGVLFDGQNVGSIGCILDGVPRSKFEFKLQNFTQQGLKLTATRSSQSTLYNSIRVSTLNCCLGFSADGEADLANTCNNDLWVDCWYSVYPGAPGVAGVSAKLGFCDSNRFHLLSGDGICQIDITKSYANEIGQAMFGKGIGLINTTGNPAGFKNKILGYGKSDGEPEPFCDSPDHLPEEFLAWIDTQGNQHGLALPHYYSPDGSVPKLPDRQHMTMWGPNGFSFAVRENGNPWAAPAQLKSK